ncbi:MAG: TonB family protein [Cyanobacteria bacterium REEB67]|nr:TonB family protein [Cyanobacteria bacterium REEB67]
MFIKFILVCQPLIIIYCYLALMPVCAAEADLTAQSYLKKIQEKMQVAWGHHRPHQSLRFPGMAPHVLIEISADGNIAKLSISQSSSDPVTDKLALQCVQESAPFGPVPASLAKENLKIDYEFRINYVGFYTENLSRRDKKAIAEAEALFSQGKFEDAVHILDLRLLSKPQFDLKTRTLTKKLAEFYLNQAIIISREDGRAEEAIALAEKSKTYGSNPTYAQEVIDRLRKDKKTPSS